MARIKKDFLDVGFSESDFELIQEGDKYADIITLCISGNKYPESDEYRQTRRAVDIWKEFVESPKYNYEDRKYYENAVSWFAREEFGRRGEITLSYQYKFCAIDVPKKEKVLL